MGPDAMIFVFWMLSFKPTFSLSSFTFIKRLFSFSSLSAIKVQFQQPGIQTEEMTVSANEIASQFSMDCLFIPSLTEVWHFQFPFSQIYYLHKSLLLFKQSSCFSDSLRISLIIYYLPLLMCPIVNLWLHCNSCYSPQFTTYLPKFCLPLTSWAHYLLKRLLAIVSLKIPNFCKL